MSVLGVRILALDDTTNCDNKTIALDITRLIGCRHVSLHDESIDELVCELDIRSMK